MKSRGFPFAAALITVAASLVLAGCITGGAHLESTASLGGDQIVVAGKIVLDPPLGPNEQNLTLTTEYERNLVYFFISKEPVDPNKVGLGTMDKMYSSKLGEPFFVVVDRTASFYYSAPMIMMDVTAGQSGDVVLPGGLKYEVPKNARAVSIGTIIYHRDPYNDVKKVDLEADDPSIQKAFAAKYGTAVTLVSVKPELEKQSAGKGK